MNDLFKANWKHLAAIIVFLAIALGYFAPAFTEGKHINQLDNEKASGMGHNQMEQYAETAEPGEFSVWSDAMFAGMPYGASYGNAAPDLPQYYLLERPIKSFGYFHASIVFASLICFYLLLSIMGVHWLLAIAGAIAFALASYNIIIIEAGHITKAYVMAYMPLVLSGMALLFKRKWLWGAVMFMLGVTISIGNSHVQITYYLVLLCLFIYIGHLVQQLRAKQYKDLCKATALMAIGVIIAASTNTKSLYSQWDLGKNSTRGKTELTTTTANGEMISSGLDKDYAFQWSYGVGELLTFLVPNAYGGGSGGTLDSSSELYRELKKHGAQVGQEFATYTYWGDKPFTSGPVYLGAIVCFLFIFGMITIKSNMKYWAAGGALFLTLLALGRNFDAFNDIMFHYLPLYNKFRTVEMALVIPGLVCPIIGIYGLSMLFKGEIDNDRAKKALTWALATTGGLTLIIWIAPTMLLSFQSPMDTQLLAQMPDWYKTALIADRANLASADALRSTIFILLAAAMLHWFIAKKKQANTISIALAILIIADLWTVDRRYLNDSNFINKSSEELYEPSTADKAIMQDKTESFRVFNLNNPWQETQTSNYHHSIGGYHAAKLRRYQELIEHRLSSEHQQIVETLQNAKNQRDVNAAFLKTPSLNMLNTKYIIYSPDAPPLINPLANGNAWFAQRNIIIAANADEEIKALQTINPKQDAVVDTRFEQHIKGFKPTADSTANIKLTSYRPNKLTYKSNAATEQLAIFSEIYYAPGWQAYIDGKPTDHFRADWTLRAMRIPAGDHEIIFEFRPKAYILAANISAYSGFLVLMAVITTIILSLRKALKKPNEQ